MRLRVHYVYEYQVEPEHYPDELETARDFASYDLDFNPYIVTEYGDGIASAEWIDDVE